MSIDDPREDVPRAESHGQAREPPASGPDGAGDGHEFVARAALSTVAHHPTQVVISENIAMRAFLARILGCSHDRVAVVD
jgi:hypothetical protein